MLISPKQLRKGVQKSNKKVKEKETIYDSSKFESKHGSLQRIIETDQDYSLIHPKYDIEQINDCFAGYRQLEELESGFLIRLKKKNRRHQQRNGSLVVTSPINEISKR